MIGRSRGYETQTLRFVDLRLLTSSPTKEWQNRERPEIRDVPSGLDQGNEKKLGEWGFEVDDSPAPAKKKVAAK